MKLNELFNNPIEPSNQSTNNYGTTVNFSVGGIPYEVMISTFGDGDWEVTFDAEIAPGDRTDQATGTGNEIAVFSTVSSIVSKFLSSKMDSVNTMAFTSSLDSRSKLYRRIATKWSTQFNMKLDIGKDIIGHDEFVLTNPNYQA